MGSCTSKSKANMQNSIQQKISDHGWMKESKCLDKFSFDQSISNKQEYEKLQEKLSLLSLQIDLAFKESESQPNYNQSFATDTLEQVKK